MVYILGGFGQLSFLVIFSWDAIHMFEGQYSMTVFQGKCVTNYVYMLEQHIVIWKLVVITESGSSFWYGLCHTDWRGHCASW